MKTTTAKANSGDVLLDADRPVLNETLLVGLDLGTNTSCLMATPVGSNHANDHNGVTRELVPTVVGYANDNVLNGVLPNDAKMLFGRMAMKHAKNLRLVRPLKGGVINDQRAARLFAGHLFETLNQANRNEIRAVIGMPASADLTARENVRMAFRGIFNKVLFVPEPFLAAIGYRNDNRITDANYHDPVLNSLYIDIGAGSTDVCLVQGHFPTANDQLSVPFAGDAVDQIILDSIMAEYPDCGLTLTRVRELKEKNSWVLNEDGSTPALANVMVGGKTRKLDVTKHVGAGCNALLQKVFEMTRELITRAEPDTVAELLQNVIVTGGGSLTKGFGVALQTKLLEEGFENPRVQVLGENYKDFVALGALKTARRARENQWQTLLG